MHGFHCSFKAATIAGALIASATGAAVGQTPLTVNLQSRLQKAYDTQCSQLLAGDADSLQASMSSDYVLTTPSGRTENREELIYYYKNAQKNRRFNKCTAVISKIKQDNLGIHVWVFNESVAVFKGSDKSIDSRGNSIDVWTDSNGKLIEVSSTDTDGTLAVDGKVVQTALLQTPDLGNANPNVFATARDWLYRLQTGDIDRQQLSGTTSTQLTDDLARQIELKLGPLGEPTAFAYVGSQQGEGFTTYEFLVTFGKVKLSEFLALDGTGKISEINFRPASSPAPPGSPRTPLHK